MNFKWEDGYGFLDPKNPFLTSPLRDEMERQITALEVSAQGEPYITIRTDGKNPDILRLSCLNPDGYNHLATKNIVLVIEKTAFEDTTAVALQKAKRDLSKFCTAIKAAMNKCG